MKVERGSQRRACLLLWEVERVQNIALDLFRVCNTVGKPSSSDFYHSCKCCSKAKGRKKIREDSAVKGRPQGVLEGETEWRINDLST